VSYQWTDRPDDGTRLGLVAQEALDVVPEVVAVPDDPDELMGMRYAELVPVLIKAIQEQQDVIETLSARVAQLEVAETHQP
jgi:hypothetical protein